MARTISTITDFDIEHAICHIVAKKLSDSFSTIDVIREILGVFISDKGVPAGSSPNALFGKRLSENAHQYRIERVLPDRLSIDDAGNPTTTAFWRAV